MNNFAQVIKNRRTRMKMSTRKLSQMIGMSSSYISELERGIIKMPPYAIAEKICAALNLDDRILDTFGLVPPEVIEQERARDLAEFERRELATKTYVENHFKRLQTMDLDELQNLEVIFNVYYDIIPDLAEFHSCLHGKDREQCISSAKDFIRFLRTKYVVPAMTPSFSD